MDIHPYTNHDIVRLRGGETLRAGEQRARHAPQQKADRDAGPAEVAAIRLLKRIRRRKEATALPDAGRCSLTTVSWAGKRAGMARFPSWVTVQ